MSFPVSSEVLTTSTEDIIPEGRCAVCKHWRRRCFNCKFTVLQHRFSLLSEVSSDDFDIDALLQINSLEYLSNNPLQIMQPREDGTFSERNRRPTGPARNEPLARYVMIFGDSLLKHSREAALEVYIDGLSHHNALPSLNLRVLLLLIELNRDVESLSFVESLMQWPTMRFTAEIWLHCRDSVEEELETTREQQLLTPELRIVVALMKSKLIQKLMQEERNYRVFQTTDSGMYLEAVWFIIAETLGVSSFLDEQKRQLDNLTQVLDPITCECIDGKRPLEESPELDGLLCPNFDFQHCTSRDRNQCR